VKEFSLVLGSYFKSLTVIPLSKIKALLGWYRATSTPNVVFLCLKRNDNMKDIKVYLLCGKAKSGKGTASTIMKEYLESKGNSVCEIQITRTIKGYIKDYFGWDGREETKPRKLLQDLGNNIRNKNPNFHIDRLEEDINVLSDKFNVFIINDIRFPFEISEIKKRFNDVVSIGIVMDNYVSPLSALEAADVTEHALDDYHGYDYKIINKSIDTLKQDIIKIIEGGK